MSRWSFVLWIVLLASGAWAEDAVRKALIRDIASVEGVRENPVLGYGMVVGLKGTGDRQQTIFTTQTLANILQHLGVQIPASTVKVNNVAAVFVTASLPPFAAPGARLDATVASVGDARSLEGGLLLLTPLYGADGKVYAAAQGPVTIGGYSAGAGGNTKQVNHPTTGRIPGGALVERDSSLDLRRLDKLSLLLADANFSTAKAMADSINHEFGKGVAVPMDSRRVDVDTAASKVENLPTLLARIEDLEVEVHRRAKVVVNERTGTIVLGQEVRLGAVSILHGNISIEVATSYQVSQPNPLAVGRTAVVPETALKTEESEAKRVALSEGASVEQLVSGLQKIGATSRDVIAILQAIKAAGALEADLEVI
jgi:flagellar P-ring protein precursor FlgI